MDQSIKHIEEWNNEVLLCFHYYMYIHTQPNFLDMHKLNGKIYSGIVNLGTVIKIVVNAY